MLRDRPDHSVKSRTALRRLSISWRQVEKKQMSSAYASCFTEVPFLIKFGQERLQGQIEEDRAEGGNPA